MNIFSEIYGAYFRITAKLLSRENLSDSDVNDLIRQEGFRDSVLFLPQKLIPQKDGSDWGLLKRNKDGSLSPVTQSKPVSFMTALRKSWLKSKLSDPKMSLFLSSKDFSALEERLSDTEPLYRQSDFRYTDIFTDGDPFEDKIYRESFRRLLNAAETGEILWIEFLSGHNKKLRGRYLPLKIEYSQKNDKFRVHCRFVARGRILGNSIINVGRICSVYNTGDFAGSYAAKKALPIGRKCEEPAVIRVTQERNGVERFFMEFASFEKHSERDLETGLCTVKLWYDKYDETELLIQLLSFGPVIEILGPEKLRRQAAERVKRQYELLENNKIKQ